MRFQVVLDTPQAGPGETVAGVARVTEDESSRRVFARLYFMESVSTGAGTHRVAELDPVTLHEGDLVAGQEFSFRLELPEGALRTYAGNQGRLAWYAEVVSDEPGFDSRGEAEVLVVPEARCARQAEDLGAGMSLSAA